MSSVNRQFFLRSIYQTEFTLFFLSLKNETQKVPKIYTFFALSVMKK